MSYNYTFNHLPLTLTHLTSSQCTIFLFSPWRKCLESWTWRGSQEAASDWTMNMPLCHIHYKTKLNSLSSSLHTSDVNSHYKSCTPGCMLVFPGDCHQVNLTYLEQNIISCNAFINKAFFFCFRGYSSVFSLYVNMYV